ncbi:MAG: arylesterase [Bryobacteraceae bacterium]|jgi:acyl-CoA thioesterase-1
MAPIIAAWLLAASGCGQKSAPSPAKTSAPPPATATTAPSDNRPTVVCFGDSLTAGFGLDPGQSYPDLLQQELDRRGYRYRVVNLGVSGDTSQDGLARLDQALAEKPRIVVVEFGANDGLRGQPVDIAERNLGQMTEAFEAAGARVVLAGITLPPNYGPAYLARFDAIFPRLAAKYKTPLIPFLLAGVAGHSGLMQSDGLHPNASGTRLVAETVRQQLEPLLSKTP